MLVIDEVLVFDVTYSHRQIMLRIDNLSSDMMKHHKHAKS